MAPGASVASDTTRNEQPFEYRYRFPTLTETLGDNFAGSGSTSRVVVDLAALAANYQQLRARSRASCAGVVKANAYGLGLEPVVATLVAQGCRDFFVATLPEALRVRALLNTLKNGLKDQSQSADEAVRIILLSGVVDAAMAEQTAAAKIEPALNSTEQARLWEPYSDQPVTVHLDTGMQRLGFSFPELEPFDWSVFNVSMLMTHLACADTPDHPMNAKQLQEFERGREYFPGVPTSIANSAGCLLPEDWHGDLTRPGIGLYGGHPQNRIPDNPLSPVAYLTGQVIARRSVPAGTPVGYGGTFVSQRATEIAVVGVGYGDGLPRSLSAGLSADLSAGPSGRSEVSIRGIRAPILGRVSMDLTHIDVTEFGDKRPKVGDWVEFLGADIGVDEMAQWAGTIGLEILCNLGARPSREYLS